MVSFDFFNNLLRNRFKYEIDWPQLVLIFKMSRFDPKYLNDNSLVNRKNRFFCNEMFNADVWIMVSCSFSIMLKFCKIIPLKGFISILSAVTFVLVTSEIYFVSSDVKYVCTIGRRSKTIPNNNNMIIDQINRLIHLPIGSWDFLSSLRLWSDYYKSEYFGK